MSGIRFLSHILLLVVFLLILFGCQSLSVNPRDSNADFRVALLVEGTIYDQGWDSQAYEGLRKIERTLGAKIDYVEHVNEENMEGYIRQFCEKGYQLIFGHGRVFETQFNRLAKEYKDVSFVFFNGDADGENVYSISFEPKSMGFFAGVTAGLMTKTNVVGTIPAFVDMGEASGFIAGVKHVNPNATILVEEVGSWGDRHKGREIANKMIQQNADVLFGAGDAFNIEIINAARESGIFAIGFVTDQSFIARDTVLVSVLQNVSEAYLQIAEKVQKKELTQNHYQFDFTNGGQTLTAFSDMVPEEKQELILKILEDYKHGKIRISE